MSEPSRDLPPVLDYQVLAPKDERPSLLVAMLLCLPGGGLWAMVFGRLILEGVGFYFPQGLLERLWSYVLLICGGATVITGIISLLFYWHKPRPWYVMINLAVNGFNLMLGVAVALGFLILSYIR